MQFPKKCTKQYTLERVLTINNKLSTIAVKNCDHSPLKCPSLENALEHPIITTNANLNLRLVLGSGSLPSDLQLSFIQH